MKKTCTQLHVHIALYHTMVLPPRRDTQNSLWKLELILRTANWIARWYHRYRRRNKGVRGRTCKWSLHSPSSSSSHRILRLSVSSPLCPGYCTWHCRILTTTVGTEQHCEKDPASEPLGINMLQNSFLPLPHHVACQCDAMSAMIMKSANTMANNPKNLLSRTSTSACVRDEYGYCRIVSASRAPVSMVRCRGSR